MASIGKDAPGTVRRWQNCSACRAPKRPGSLGAVSAASVRNASTNFSQGIKLVDSELM